MSNTLVDMSAKHAQGVVVGLLTVQLDPQLVGGPSEGHAPGGGRAWHGGAAEQHVAAQGLLQHGVPQAGETLAPVDTLV